MRKLKESVRLLAIAGMFFLFFTAVLYQRGVFDFSFYPREHGDPVKTTDSSATTPLSSDSAGGIDEPDDEYSLQFIDSLRAATNISRIGAGVLTGGDPVPFAFEKFTDLIPEGYELSYADFDSDGTMRLCLLEPDISLPAYGSYEITELVFYSEAKDDYSVPIGKQRFELKSGSGVRLYMGYILTDDGNEQRVYTWNGKLLLKEPSGYLYPALTRDTEGHPLFTLGDSKYYRFDESGKLIESDYNDETDGRGLYFDYTPDYGAGDNDILRFSVRTIITSLVTAPPEETEAPPETLPPETDSPVTVYTEEPVTEPPAETDVPAETTDVAAVPDFSESTENSDTGETEETSEDTGNTESAEITDSAETIAPEENEPSPPPEETTAEGSEDTETGNSSAEEGELSSDSPIPEEITEGSVSEAGQTTEGGGAELLAAAADLPDDTDDAPAETGSDPSETTGLPEESTQSSSIFTENPENPETSESTEGIPATETETEPEPPVTTAPPRIVDIISTEELRFAYGYSSWYLLTGYKYSRMFNFSEGYGVSVWYDKVLSVVNEYGQEDWRFTRQLYYWNENGRLAYSIYTEPLTRGIASLGSYYFDRGYLRVRQLDTDAYYGNPDYLIGQYDFLLDKEGNKFAIPEGYDLVGYSDGVLLLSRGGKYGYYSTEIGWIAQPIYTFARPFAEGLGVIGFQNGIKGIIDTKGNVVLPFVYTDISQISSGVIAAYSAETGWEFYGKVCRPETLSEG